MCDGVKSEEIYGLARQAAAETASAEKKTRTRRTARKVMIARENWRYEHSCTISDRFTPKPIRDAIDAGKSEKEVLAIAKQLAAKAQYPRCVNG